MILCGFRNIGVMELIMSMCGFRNIGVMELVMSLCGLRNIGVMGLIMSLCSLESPLHTPKPSHHAAFLDVSYIFNRNRIINKQGC